MEYANSNRLPDDEAKKIEEKHACSKEELDSIYQNTVIRVEELEALRARITELEADNAALVERLEHMEIALISIATGSYMSDGDPAETLRKVAEFAKSALGIKEVE